MKQQISSDQKGSAITRDNDGNKARVIPFKAKQSRAQSKFNGQISIEDCKAILCKDGAEYSDVQVEVIRRVLYALAEVDYKYHTDLNQNSNQQQATIISLDTLKNDEQQESHTLFPRKYRRAS